MVRKRKEFTAKTKLLAFERCGGFCEKCKGSFNGKKPEYDHILPDALGGDNSLVNCQVLCKVCHTAKTTKQDVPAISKTKRLSLSVKGIKQKGNHKRGKGTHERVAKTELPKRPLYAPAN